MKKYLVFLLIALFAVFTGCSSTTEEETIVEFDVLVKYLEAGDEDYEGWVNNMDGWILNLADINTADYFVLDIRSESAYNNMHIDGAVNSTMPGIFDAVENATKPILVVCYSGQSASYAHMLLRLAGEEAYSLKFGMSIYDASLDKWTSNCSNDYASHSDWVTTASDPLPSFNPPKLSTGKKTGAEILQARLTAVAGMWTGTTIPASIVMTAPGSFNIMNYWGETDYLGLGHIDGAYQLSVNTLKTSSNLYVFDPESNNILYCWTGQTAAATIAYLKVLGYEDVQSISYGVNSMIYDELSSHKWPKPWN